MAVGPLSFNSTLSIVSHGQGTLVAPLLADIARHCGDSLEVVVVVNVPEDERYLQEFPRERLQVVRSEKPRGFGANHNEAARVARGRHLFVVNPDIGFDADPLPALLSKLEDPRVGVVGPRVLSPSGAMEETARSFPTVHSLARKAMRRHAPAPLPGSGPTSVDWIAGMFLGIRLDAFKSLGGFDEKFFLYYEDVDLCARARSRGLDVVWQSACTVFHDARRQSHQNLMYLKWHVSSASRYLLRRATGRYR